MPCIDCYLVPVPRENKAAYEELARISAAVVREHGALRVLECWLGESGPEASSYHATEAGLDSENYGNFVTAEGVDVSGVTKAYVRGESLGFHFCPNCGCVAYWRSLAPNEERRRRIAVNLRPTEPEPVAHLPIDHFDGLDKWEDLPRDGRCIRDMWF